ncbi:MAG: uridine kinase, partial [Fimbriimonadales bacterium]
MDRLAIAIAGATASGKTTLARAVADLLPCTILRTDDYYRNLDHLPFEERCKLNFDHPSAVEGELLAEHVRRLLEGRSVEAPRYDFTRHTRFAETHTVVPSRFLIVEGLFALCDPRLADLCAVRVFVDTPEEVCLQRRLARDVLERGRTPVEVIERFSSHVAPMFRLHVLPTMALANVVVRGTEDVVQAAERVVAKVRE